MAIPGILSSCSYSNVNSLCIISKAGLQTCDGIFFPIYSVLCSLFINLFGENVLGFNVESVTMFWDYPAHRSS